MQKSFLRIFIEEEKYMQNYPLKTKEFIDYCKKRGIETNEKELEFFEKEGLLYPIFRINRPIVEEEWVKFKDVEGEPKCRPSNNGLLDGEVEIERYMRDHYYSYGFSNRDKENLLHLMEEGNLFDPKTKPFQKWSSFKGKNLSNGNEKIVTYYSYFQIYWLEILKKDFTVTINFAGEEIKVSSNSHCIRANSGSFSIKKIDEFNDKYKSMAEDKIFKNFFDFKIKKECLNKQYEQFEQILEFLLSIQSIYVPYGRSSSKTISVMDGNWHEKRNNFDPKIVLDVSGFIIQEIVNLYWNFSRKTEEILGIKRDDWIQLWKSIGWDEKDRLEGTVRLGIEYLQWASMLKRFIQDYCGREILDIDEITNISPDDILRFDPSEMDGQGRLLRQLRTKWYSDPEKNKNYYHDKYKRLFYLANDFNLDYQPRVMVFVEGETEEEFFPKIFEWYSDYPENHGIEIVNFKGVDQLLSTSKNAKKLKNSIRNIEIECRKQFISPNQKNNLSKLIKELKKTNIIISNWTSFISYNLEKWQIIPFFVSDNEGNVKHFLEAEEPIIFEGKNYNVPDEWKYLWGITNDNAPYYGNNFELANFSDEELLLAINQVLDDEIDINKIKEIRENEEGIKQIDDRLNHKKNKRGSKNKRDVVRALFENLFEEYEETENKLLLKRPIFELIEKIVELGHFNHPPVWTEIEIKNKKYISDILGGNV